MRRPAAIALLVAMVAAGCGFKQEPTRSIGPHFPVTVSDAAGREVTLAAAPRRIVVTDPAGASILKAIGAKTIAVGSGASVAALRRRHPDLIVLSPQTTPQRADVIEHALGVPTYVLAGFALTSIERGVAALGLATGHPLAGRNMALSLRARRRALEHQIARSTRQSVFADTGFGYSIASGGLLAELVADARGRLVGTGLPQPVSQKRLQKLRPDVYLTLASSHVTLQILRKRPLTARLPAVLSGRVLIVDDARIEPDLDAYRLLEQIAHFLHPESTP